ncbi:TetR/AcrR family transcriptional regulator [Paramicrobacterium sp. CJ85]|uniref:TetR/AcrR family transcriptional regulator n=1 Tax=Paramicrobacterium sp. CJ85 TaxID=3445355 RepID=UPI003F647E1A
MPKIVDAQARREAIANAVLQVIAEGGLRAATFAQIAARAGLAVGSVRHYFVDHGDVLQFAASEVVNRTATRLEAHVSKLEAASSGDARLRIAVDMLCEVLPLDSERTVEAVVWLEFAIASRGDRALAPSIDALHTGLRTLIHRIVSSGVSAGRFDPAIDVDVEVARLHALVDGLLLHGVLVADSAAAPEHRRVIEGHLRSLYRDPIA